jgi:hypothetical protein
MCSSAPNTDGMNAAALAQADMSKEQLAWAKEIYAQTAPDRAAAVTRANAVSDAQMTALNKQTALTDDYANYNKTTFRPLEQGIVRDAATFDSEANQAKAAGLALADVNQGFSSAREQNTRAMSRMGVNPSSGRSLAMGNQTAIAQAAAQAGAMTKARSDTQLQGYARKMDAANMGRGLASSQATSAGVALSQGNSAVANGMQSGNINAQGNQIMTQGYAGAQSGMAGAGSTYGNIASIEQKAGDNSAIWGALGGVAGAYLGKPSDKNIKNSRKKISGKASLDQIKNLPSNESWRYNKGSIADDGGKTHQGHMAQDVNRVMGEKAAPGGKVINLEVMASAGLAAIKEVAKGQQKLHKRLTTLENSRRK